MAATIAVASAKGGCGKTTTVILLATYLAQAGYRVTVLDADVNQHAAAFGQISEIENFKVVGDITQDNVLPAIRAAEADHSDIVIIDLPGGTSVLSLKAMQRAHMVLVPTQASLPDVKDAVKTIHQVEEAQELTRLPIERALLWTRVPAGFESVSARHVRQHVEAMDLPLFRTALMERAAFREMHVTGKAPGQTDPKGAAAANVAAIAEELLVRLAPKENA
jgi:chromosome partitioning protein